MRRILDRVDLGYKPIKPGSCTPQCVYTQDGVVHRVEVPKGATTLYELPVGPLNTRSFMPAYTYRWRVYNPARRAYAGAGDSVWIKGPRYVGLYDDDGEWMAETTARELDVLATLNTPKCQNLCNYHGCVVDGDVVSGLVYERLHTTLHEQVTKISNAISLDLSHSEPLAPQDHVPVNADAVLRDVRAGLDYIRSHGLVYVDLSPNNIMWRPAAAGGGQWCLIDFSECYAPGTFFSDGVPGTPGWMSATSRVVNDELTETSLRRLDTFMRTGVSPAPSPEPDS